MLDPDAISADAPMLRFHNVSVTYPEQNSAAVQGVNFTLNTGESALFLGPSGCGKSTLAMAGARLIPTAVEAKVEGEVWFHPDTLRPGRVGYVFQDPDAQFCMLNVADEVAFGLENQSLPPIQMEKRIRSALREAGLDVPLSAEHATFSGGMKQKLAIASALALKPDLLVLDEPTANLDPASSRLVFEQIARLHDAGQTMIVIEHKFDPLLPIMDRVVLFDREGRIYREGSTLPVIAKEWEWLVATGVVASWKLPPQAVSAMRHAHTSAPTSDHTMIHATAVPSAVKFAHTDGHTPPRSDVRGSHAEPSTSDTAFTLKDARLSYRKHTVLKGLTLSIQKGDFVAVVGPNGAGKSSVLQLLAGLWRPSSGKVELFGRSLDQWSVKDRYAAIAYSFQNPELQFIYERVGDELANRVVGDDVPASILALLNQFGLDGLAGQSPFSLSQGQKRRLSVAAMMRNAHEVYLFDEPTFGQDAKTQAAIMERMRALHAGGKTIVMTTHDMDLVRRYASSVIVIVDGRVIYQGDVEGLWMRSDILRAAHLLDESMEVGNSPNNHSSSLSMLPAKPDSPTRHKPPIARLHPGWVFVAMFATALLSLFAHTMPQALAELALPLVVMMGLGFMSPWKIAKYLAPFLVFYVLYLWSFVANAAVPPGTPTWHFLWYQFSFYGLHEGLILSIRMLGSVLFGILFVTQMDITDFMVALTMDFRVPPKFAYGTMAGLRLVPLFSAEWTKLRQARQIRGKEGSRVWTRPVTYALPLLSQGVRMSERVAIAMEARGFIDEAAASAKGRTFYRQVKVRWWDLAISGMIVLLALAGIFV